MIFVPNTWLLLIDQSHENDSDNLQRPQGRWYGHIKNRTLDKSLQIKGRRQVVSCSAKRQKKDKWEYIGMYRVFFDHSDEHHSSDDEQNCGP